MAVFQLRRDYGDSGLREGDSLRGSPIVTTKGTVTNSEALATTLITGEAVFATLTTSEA